MAVTNPVRLISRDERSAALARNVEWYTRQAFELHQRIDDLLDEADRACAMARRCFEELEALDGETWP